jgi:hypothetical protein
MTTDLELAYNALAGKQEAYKTLWAYYDGDHPLRYSASRLRDVFQHADARFTQNWCAVIVDAALDRMELKRWTAGDDLALTTMMNDLWTQSEMTFEDVEVHRATLVIGEAFVIVWPDADGQVQGYYNDPALCHVFYDSDNPHRKRMAAKWYVDEDGLRRMTLYYPDRLAYYVSRVKSDTVGSASALFSAEEPEAENPYGEIPVFHFRRERRKVRSEIANALPIQDAVNKLTSDMMVAAEFGAFKQRWVISNADTSMLKNAPNELWEIPAGDGIGQGTQVGEFGEMQLNPFLASIESLSLSMAAITRTPKHYFMSKGGDPSGEALIAMEAPLNKRVSRYVESFSNTWRDVARFMLRIQGTDVPAEMLEPVFAPVETVQPRTQAEIRQMSTSAGMPLRVVLQREGWSQAELEGLDQATAAQSAAQQNQLAQAMLNAQRDFDQGANTGAAYG